MLVYTFSTGGCRDGIYLESLSSTKDGVVNLIKEFYETYSDKEFSSIHFEGNKITVWYIDTDMDIADKDFFDLVSFSVL